MINRQRNATNRLAESVWNRNNNIAEPAKSAETNNASYENDALEKQRNATNRLAESVWNRNNNTAAVPAVPEVPNTKNNNSAPAAMPKRTYKPYDANTDYTALINSAVKNGNYALAAEYEKLRNMKIGDMGLPYEVTDNFNYIDRNGYGGEADRLYNAIEQYNRDGFNYDYKSDPRYQQILAQQKKEAEAQFENGLAELSQRFGGDVPANLIGGLLKTSQDTIDAADNYIPQLWQMAQDMWMNEGNQLYNQYNLASMRASDDYNKWAADRGFYTQGFENAHARNLDDRNYKEDVRRYEDGKEFQDKAYADSRQDYADDVAYRDKVFDRDVFENDRNFEYQKGLSDFDMAYRDKVFDRDVFENDRNFEYQKGLSDFDMVSAISNDIYRNYQMYIDLGYSPAKAREMAATIAKNFYGQYYPDYATMPQTNSNPTTATPPPATLTNEEEKEIVAAIAESEGMALAMAQEFAEKVAASVVAKKIATSVPENHPKKSTTSNAAKKSTSTNTTKKNTESEDGSSGNVIIDANENIAFKKK